MNQQQKIYFCGSVNGQAPNLNNYKIIVDYLKQNFGQVLTEFNVDYSLNKNQTDREMFNEDKKLFEEATVMIAEVSSPSHGVGIELGWASLRADFPVLCLRAKNSEFNVSALINGCKTFKFYNYEKIEDSLKIISDFFQNEVYKSQKL